MYGVDGNMDVYTSNAVYNNFCDGSRSCLALFCLVIMTGHQMLLLLCINYFDISTKPLVIKWLFIYAFQHKNHIAVRTLMYILQAYRYMCSFDLMA